MAWAKCLLVCVCWALSGPLSALVLENEATVIDLLAEGGHLYQAAADAPPREAPQSQAEIADFLGTLEPVTRFDRVSGGTYWLSVPLHNASNNVRWIFDPYNSITDTFKVSLYSAAGVQHSVSGYLHNNAYPLHYGVLLDLPQQAPAHLLVSIESRYFSGEQQLELVSQAQYASKVTRENSLLLGCLGAMVLLGVYNLFIGFWTKDRSYLYYSGYLLMSVVAWAAGFNLLAEWLGWYTYGVLLPPFYLTVAFNLLYVVHFLELRHYQPAMKRACYALSGLMVALALAQPLFQQGYYMLIYVTFVAVWLCLGLWAGINRLLEGYQPARFFVAAFAVMAAGMAVSILATLGFQPLVKNTYLFTLVAQTIEVLLLALALADRINLLRQQRQTALEESFEIERKAADVQREANAKLQQALDLSEEESRRKSEFLRMVSHELRTPLHSILSSAEQWDSSTPSTNQQELVEFISYGAARLRTQIDNLVLFAETDRNTLEPGNYEFELYPLLDKLQVMANSLLGRNVKLLFEREGQLPPVYRGDPYLLEHLLRTVIENACKYTARGEVSFSLRWVAEDSELAVRVKDTGCGMSRQQLQDVYQEFVQVSRGLDRDSEGLGLGLTICYRISELLGASFQIRSEPGEGTEVCINVPLEVVNAELRLVGRHEVGRGKLLVVEDNHVNAQVLARLLRSLDYDVTIVHSGQEAIELLGNVLFDLILMDIQMPVMDGITATRWIRRRGINTPVVAVTANSDIEVRRRCMEQGMNDFLVKPVQRLDILRILERQLPGSV